MPPPLGNRIRYLLPEIFIRNNLMQAIVSDYQCRLKTHTKRSFSVTYYPGQQTVSMACSNPACCISFSYHNNLQEREGTAIADGTVIYLIEYAVQDAF